MSVLTVLAVIGIVVYVIGQQLAGSPLSGKRLIVLPAVVTGIGILDLSNSGSHPAATDIVLLSVSAVIAIAIGVGLGAMTRLERRDGYLWAQLPKRGLWLWGGLLVSRVAVTGIAHASGAHVAAGTAAILLMLGLNRAAQALVVAPRAVAAGIPFAPEKDGTRVRRRLVQRTSGLSYVVATIERVTGRRSCRPPDRVAVVAPGGRVRARRRGRADVPREDRRRHRRAGNRAGRVGRLVGQ